MYANGNWSYKIKLLCSQPNVYVTNPTGCYINRFAIGITWVLMAILLENRGQCGQRLLEK